MRLSPYIAVFNKTIVKIVQLLRQLNYLIFFNSVIIDIFEEQQIQAGLIILLIFGSNRV